MNFAHYQQLAEQSHLEFDATWAQGRSVFGGLSAAVVLEHIERHHAPEDQQLRSVHVNFCGPTVTEETCELRVQPLSGGRSVTQITGQLIQDGQVKTQLVVMYAKRRQSSVAVPSTALDISENRDQFKPLPYIEGVTPVFIQHLSLVFSNNNFPFTGSTNTQVTGWTQFRDTSVHQQDQLSNSALLALIDAWPPVLLSLLKKPAPASSISWNIEFIQPDINVAATDELYYQCDIQEASDGYGHTEARIYTAAGQLLAFSRQVVGVYDQK